MTTREGSDKPRRPQKPEARDSRSESVDHDSDQLIHALDIFATSIVTTNICASLVSANSPLLDIFVRVSIHRSFGHFTDTMLRLKYRQNSYGPDVTISQVNSLVSESADASSQGLQ